MDEAHTMPLYDLNGGLAAFVPFGRETMSVLAELHQAHRERHARLWAARPEPEAPPEPARTYIAPHRPPGPPTLEEIINRNIDYAMLLWIPDEPRRRANVTVREIGAVVCRHYRVRWKDVESLRRTANLVLARHVIMHLAKLITPLSFPQIGRFVGGRDHTTVLHADRKIEGKRRADPDLDATLTMLEREITGEA